MRIEWHPRARTDLAELVACTAADNTRAACRVHDEIRSQTEALAEHPRMGGPGRVRGTRELVVGGTPHIVAYRLGEDAVTVLRVLHAARLRPRRI